MCPANFLQRYKNNLMEERAFQEMVLEQSYEVKCETLTPSGNNTENLQNRKLGKEILDSTPKAQAIKDKFDKLYFIKSTIFYSAKDHVKGTTRLRLAGSAGRAGDS